MPALTTTDQLFEYLRKSRLVDDRRLEAFVASALPMPEEPRALAKLLISDGLITAFQASQLLAGKWRGFLVANGKYKLLELLGIGGMGKVYLVEHIRMKRLVALKVLPTDKLAEPTSLERFEREARASGALDHPNIVRAHDLDSDQDGKLHFLVMEYVDGATLHDIVKKHGPMEVVRACHYISQAAEGLQHAHETAGLIHRDIKPGNILVDRLGTVKLLDMGLARFFHDDSANPLTRRFEKNNVLGTADFLAPEQALDSSDVDIRADIYGLGSTFYFLLTGRPPFDHGTISEKLMWHQSKEPEPIRARRPEVPEALAAIVSTMMAKQPDQRFADPAEVIEALDRWTATPIDPPADVEMPRLCPALLAYGLAGLPVLPNGSGALSGRMRPRPGPRSTAINRHSTMRIRRPEPPAKKRQALGWILGYLILGAALAGLIWYVNKPPPKSGIGPHAIDSSKRSPPAGNGAGALPPPAPNVTYVSSSSAVRFANPGRTDLAATLGEALANARSGARIVVLDSVVNGQLRIDGKLIRDVRIESGARDGNPVVWKPLSGEAAKVPLLTLSNAGATSICGIEFDGGRRIESLVHIEGDSTGLQIQHCRLTDAVKTPLVVVGAAASRERPLTLERVRITSSREYRDASGSQPAAIQFIDGASSGTLGFRMRWCRVEGAFQTGLKVETAIDADVQFNRWFSSAAGPSGAIALRIPDSGSVNLSLASNTSMGFGHLLRLERIPPVKPNATVVLRSNLMATGDGFVDAGASSDQTRLIPLFATSTGNVGMEGVGSLGPLSVVPIGAGKELLRLDRNTDEFLRYSRYIMPGVSNPLISAGSGGEPAGVPPIE